MDSLEKDMNAASNKRFPTFQNEYHMVREIDSCIQKIKDMYQKLIDFTLKHIKKVRLKLNKRWNKMRNDPVKFDAESIRIMKIQTECDRDRKLNFRVKQMLIVFMLIHIKKQLKIKLELILQKKKLDKQWKKMRMNSKKFDEETIRIMKIQTECDRDRMLNLRVKAKLIKFIKQHLDYVQIQEEHHQQMLTDDHNWNIICQLAKTDSCTDQYEIDYLNSQLIT
jgi:hypothetical protein